MFYVKEGFSVIEINDNAYTNCIECGRPIKVDLREILKEGDLETTKVACEKCSMNKNERQKKIVHEYYRTRSWLLDDFLKFAENADTGEMIEYVREMTKEAKDLEKEFIEKRDKEE